MLMGLFGGLFRNQRSNGRSQRPVRTLVIKANAKC
jgi:hypothetical protein